MSTSSQKLSVWEKTGYSLGDAAANFVWRSTYFLPFFYTDTFGLAAAQVALLLLLVRLSDGITDIIMGSIADRTNTSQGKFRPWIIWTAPVLATFMVLVFTTPNLDDTGKLVYAYVIYFGLTLAYTANNVPYGAMMGVMTASVQERASISAFRFAGAFGGGLLVMTLLPYFVQLFGKGNDAQGYQYTMIIFAILLILFMVMAYKSTTERISLPQKNSNSLCSELKEMLGSLPVILVPVLGLTIFFVSLSQTDWSIESKIVGLGIAITSFIVAVFMRSNLIKRDDNSLTAPQRDMKDLLTNKPWLILLIVGTLFGIFTVVRPSAAGYYFKYYLEREDLLSLYFFVVTFSSLLSAIATGYLTKFFRKRTLFIASFILGGIFNGAIYTVEPDQVTYMMLLAFIGEIFAAIMPVLFFSMLGDTADYSEWKHGRRATGLIYSAGTFIMKTGHGFAGAIVLIVLANYDYNAAVESSIAEAIDGMRHLMATIPLIICAIGTGIVMLYPLTEEKLTEIEKELEYRRALQ